MCVGHSIWIAMYWFYWKGLQRVGVLFLILFVLLFQINLFWVRFNGRRMFFFFFFLLGGGGVFVIWGCYFVFSLLPFWFLFRVRWLAGDFSLHSIILWLKAASCFIFMMWFTCNFWDRELSICFFVLHTSFEL